MQVVDTTTTVGAAGARTTWHEVDGRCDNVASGVVIDVLTAAVGPVSNPQEKITFVRVKPAFSSWQFPASADGGKAPFAITATVRFARQPQSAGDVVRSLPPLSTFPKDLFYPFTT